MLLNYPRQLPRSLSLFQCVSLDKGHMGLLCPPAIWPISDRNSDITTFQNQLKKQTSLADSYFRKWLGCDLISGSITDVVNFLATLHSQGYQASSLNAYQSAISSVHDGVDDMDVDKHPMISRPLKGDSM